MAQSSAFTENSVLYETTMKFVKLCASEFEWNDLSEDVIMDVGCGTELPCSKALLEQFPSVKILIAVDKNINVFPMGKSTDKRIQFRCANILQRDSLKSFEGKVDKILSTNVIHQIQDKELAFQNVYRLLKPGGEAAFYFCVGSPMIDFVAALLEIPKYKAMFKGSFTKDVYPEGQRKQFFKEILEKIGFKDVRSIEEVLKLAAPSEEEFKQGLFDGIKKNFEIPPEFEKTFKDEILQIYTNTVGKYDGKLCYVSVELALLGVKTMLSVDSKVDARSNA